MDKLQLRNSTAEILKNRNRAEKKMIEKQLLDHLLASRLWENSVVIGLTISRRFEWNTEPIIEAAWSQGKIVAIPKSSPAKKQLLFYKFQSYDQLENVYYNLLEPKPEKTLLIDKKAIDLLIVPGLLFDNRGYRIGFGGGYYDRFLVDFPNETLSLTSDQQLIDALPIDSYDIPVKHLITESGFVK